MTAIMSSTERRTQQDWAHYIQHLADDFCPTAKRITLVCDQLHTHCLASRYETFAPQEAHRLARKLELIHTPKHGSWLNLAEFVQIYVEHSQLDTHRHRIR